MHTVLIVIHVLLAIAMIGMVLVQRGPGATAGAAFGSGASSTVFGSRGAGSFLTRTTAILATGFFLISLGLAVLVSRGGYVEAAQDLGIMQSAVQQQPQGQEQEQPPSGEQAPPPAAGAVPSAQGSGTDSDVPAAPPEQQPADENNDQGGGQDAPPEGDGGG